MEQVIVSGYADNLDPINTEYNKVAGGLPWVIGAVNQVVSASGKFKDLRFRLNGAPGGVASYTFTLVVNGAAMALTCTIAGAATMGSDTVNEVNVVPGDTVTIECTPAGGPTPRYATWTIIFEGANPRESLILGYGHTFPSVIIADYNFCNGGENWGLETQKWQVVSTPGSIKNLHVLLTAAPGVGASYTLTLRVNGVSTALTCTVAGAATTCSDLVNSVVVAAGDRITLECSPTNNPAAASPRWGMTFVADTDGECLILGGTGRDVLNTLATEYNYLNGIEDVWTAIESDRYHLGQECTAKNLHIYLDSHPGVGDKYTFYLRLNVGDTVLTCTITGPSQSCSDVVNEVAISDDDYLDLKSEPGAGIERPAARYAFWGLTLFRQPPPPFAGGSNIVLQAKTIIE